MAESLEERVARITRMNNELRRRHQEVEADKRRAEENRALVSSRAPDNLDDMTPAERSATLERKMTKFTKQPPKNPRKTTPQKKKNRHFLSRISDDDESDEGDFFTDIVPLNKRNLLEEGDDGDVVTVYDDLKSITRTIQNLDIKKERPDPDYHDSRQGSSALRSDSFQPFYDERRTAENASLPSSSRSVSPYSSNHSVRSVPVAQQGLNFLPGMDTSVPPPPLGVFPEPKRTPSPCYGQAAPLFNPGYSSYNFQKSPEPAHSAYEPRSVEARNVRGGSAPTLRPVLGRGDDDQNITIRADRNQDQNVYEPRRTGQHRQCDTNNVYLDEVQNNPSHKFSSSSSYNMGSSKDQSSYDRYINPSDVRVPNGMKKSSPYDRYVENSDQSNYMPSSSQSNNYIAHASKNRHYDDEINMDGSGRCEELNNVSRSKLSQLPSEQSHYTSSSVYSNSASTHDRSKLPHESYMNPRLASSEIDFSAPVSVGTPYDAFEAQYGDYNARTITSSYYTPSSSNQRTASMSSQRSHRSSLENTYGQYNEGTARQEPYQSGGYSTQMPCAAKIENHFGLNGDMASHGTHRNPHASVSQETVSQPRATEVHSGQYTNSYYGIQNNQSINDYGGVPSNNYGRFSAESPNNHQSSQNYPNNYSPQYDVPPEVSHWQSAELNSPAERREETEYYPTDRHSAQTYQEDRKQIATPPYSGDERSSQGSRNSPPAGAQAPAVPYQWGQRIVDWASSTCEDFNTFESASLQQKKAEEPRSQVDGRDQKTSSANQDQAKRERKPKSSIMARMEAARNDSSKRFSRSHLMDRANTGPMHATFNGKLVGINSMPNGAYVYTDVREANN